MINTRKHALPLLASLALAGAAACNNDTITEANKNPNAPEDAPAGAVFTQAVVGNGSGNPGLAGRMIGNGFDLRQMEFLAQHLAENQYPDEDRYARIRAGDVGGTFTGPYSAELADLKQVIKKGKAANQAGVWAPADILSQWEFGYITAAWGDIPYSQALAGDSVGGSLTPAYDAQKDVYAGMLSHLTADASALSGAAGSLGGADPIYGGAASKWQKFANSLRARYAIQLVNADPSKADAELKAAFAAPGGAFTSNADNAQVAYPGDGVFDNPWANNFKSRDDHRMSKTLIDILTANNDPRLAMWAEPTQDFATGKSTVKFAGQPNGLSAAAASTFSGSTSRIGQFIYPAVTPFGRWAGIGPKQATYLLTFAEVSFIKAEAAQRGIGGFSPASAPQFYADGIRASIQQWAAATQQTVTAAQIDAYIAQPGVALQSGTAGLKQIAQQKWLALFLDGAQAWFEWRRTCTPSTIKPGPAAIFATVPRRLEYPTAEQSVNGENLKAAIARQGADNMQTALYIDKPSAAPTCQ